MHDTIIAVIGLVVTALWIMWGVWCAGNARGRRTTIEIGAPREAGEYRFSAYVVTCSSDDDGRELRAGEPGPCAHPRLIPIDAHWAQCALCGDDTFPADGAPWTEIE